MAKNKEDQGTGVVVFAGMAFFNLRGSWSAIYQRPLDLHHPFVYVNSTYDFKNVDDLLQILLIQRPGLREEVIQVSLDEVWPMPWTLQDSHECIMIT